MHYLDDFHINRSRLNLLSPYILDCERRGISPLPFVDTEEYTIIVNQRADVVKARRHVRTLVRCTGLWKWEDFKFAQPCSHRGEG